MMKNLFLFLIVSFSCVLHSVAQTISVFEIKENIKPDRNILLLGENHSGRDRYNILDQYVEILTQNEIDTVFVEMPFSSYFNAQIEKDGFRREKLEAFTNANKVLIPIDIEFDLMHAFHMILEVYSENFLTGSKYYEEHLEITRQFLKSKKCNIPFLMDYLKRIRENVTPLLIKYQSEFLTLVDNIEETYANFEVYEFESLDDSVLRDSLMALKIKRYVQENNLQKWGGFFGSMHIGLPEDNMFKLADIRSNMISFLLKEGVLYVDSIQNYSRIIYDSVKKIKRAKKVGFFNNTFLDEYDAEFRNLKKRMVFLVRKDKTYWLVSKK